MESRFTAIRNGRMLDIAGHRADVADILIEGDIIREIGPRDWPRHKARVSSMRPTRY